MQKYNQSGSTSVVIAVVSTLLFIAALVFAIWAFQGRQDYKNNVMQKVNAAVSAAQKVQITQDQQKFDQEAKNPNKTYQGSSTYGSITFSYPKTWSAYVDETNSANPIEGYFYPSIVPGLQGGTAFALRVELVSNSYTNISQQFTGLIKQGKVKATAFVPPQMVGKPNVQPGTRFDGAIATNQSGMQQGSLVAIQVRDKTLEIYTESANFLADYNNVLQSLTYIP